MDVQKSRLVKRLIVFGAGLLVNAFFAPPASASDFLYTDAQADCAARIIFMNECSGKDSNLIYWSADEAFPSLGIGHFIWYPAGDSGPYRESFVDFLSFAAEQPGLTVPAWIQALGDKRAPWKTRREFLEDMESERMKELYAFLQSTKRQQVHFMIRRFQRTFPAILDEFEPGQRETIREKYDLLMKNPKGVFAMIDYVNFKGEGLRGDARYGDMGWGLAQVLEEMEMPDYPEYALDEFVDAAQFVLERRVQLAPKPDVESKWLAGWKNRVARYLSIDCESF